MTCTLNVFDGCELTPGYRTIIAGTALTLETTRVRYSRGSHKMPSAHQGADELWRNWYAFGYTSCAAMCHLYIESLPGSSQHGHLIQIRHYSHTQAMLRINENGKISVYNYGTSTWSADSANALSTGVWYTVSLSYLLSTASGIVANARDLSGTLVATITHTGTSGGDYGASIVDFGNNVTFTGDTSYGVYYFDNLVVCDITAAGDDPFTLYGHRYAIAYLGPNEAGSYNPDGWTGSYADTDDFPTPDDATTMRTYAGYGNAGFADKVQGLADVLPSGASAASVKSVDAWSRVARWYGVPGLGNVLYTHSTRYDSGGWGSTAWSDPQNMHGRYDTNPYTGSAWTLDEIADLQMGSYSYAAAGGAGYSTMAGAEVLCSLSMGQSFAFWWITRKWKDLLRDLKAGLVPPRVLRERYGELVRI